MLIRPIRFTYLGSGIIFVWVILTWYLIVFRPTVPSYRNEENEVSYYHYKADLWHKTGRLVKEIAAQKAEHAQLLEVLRNSPVQLSRIDVPQQIEGPVIDGGSRQSVEAIAVLVIACNRSEAVTNHLNQLLKLRPSKDRFPIVVSQDCQHDETTRAIKQYGDEIIFIKQPDQSAIVVPAEHEKYLGYYKISRHYRWALNQTFYTYGFNATVITEDDLDIAIDFFEYFAGTVRLLELDPSLWCVSAWNDNGKDGVIEANPKLLYRSDFFSGLGWMMRKSLWSELEPQWPRGFWDDWMRRPDIRKDRACIRPEIPRTAMSPHGEIGVSEGLFYETHLKFIKLNTVEKVHFPDMDLSHLLKEKYDKSFVRRVTSAPSVSAKELIDGHFENGTPLPSIVRLTYWDNYAYRNVAGMFKLMEDFKSGVPRTAYKGIVPFMYGKIRVYLAPGSNWTGYDPTW